MDVHNKAVDITVTRDPNGGYRVIIMVDGKEVLRAWRAALVLDGLELPRPYRRKKDNEPIEGAELADEVRD